MPVTNTFDEFNLLRDKREHFDSEISWARGCFLRVLMTFSSLPYFFFYLFFGHMKAFGFWSINFNRWSVCNSKHNEASFPIYLLQARHDHTEIKSSSVQASLCKIILLLFFLESSAGHFQRNSTGLQGFIMWPKSEVYVHMSHKTINSVHTSAEL